MPNTKPQKGQTYISHTELLAAEDSQDAQPSQQLTRQVLLPAWVLDEEFELVKQALWTEPDDQAGWLYHRWLLGTALATREAAQGVQRSSGFVGVHASMAQARHSKQLRKRRCRQRFDVRRGCVRNC